MVCMIPVTTRSAHDHAVRYPREIAAAVTLRAACAALVEPGPGHGPRAASAAVVTACSALATRLAVVRFLADPGSPSPRSVRPLDPFTEPTPAGLLGTGPRPVAPRVRTAGDRCTDAWRTWRADGAAGDAVRGAAGALSVAAWAAWALGSVARAETRARYALDLRSDDPLAGLVLRSVLAGARPAWERR